MLLLDSKQVRSEKDGSQCIIVSLYQGVDSVLYGISLNMTAKNKLLCNKYKIDFLRLLGHFPEWARRFTYTENSSTHGPANVLTSGIRWLDHCSSKPT